MAFEPSGMSRWAERDHINVSNEGKAEVSEE